MRAALSIRHRLAAMAILLVVIAAAANAVSAHRTFRHEVLAGARQRAASVAQQLSDLLATSARQVRDHAKAESNDSLVIRYLSASDELTRRTLARTVLARLTRVDGARTPVLAVELWDAAAHRLLATQDSVAPMSSADALALAALTSRGPLADGSAIGWIGHGATGALEYAVIAAAPRDPAGKPIGFVVERRPLTMSQQGSAQLRDLIGKGTSLLVGNTRGDLWTNFVSVAPSPPVPAADSARILEYERPRGNPVVAAMVPIRNTPWTIAVETPMAIVLSPVRQMLTRLAMTTLALVMVTGLAAWVLSRSLTRPIQELVSVAEGMSAGDESERVIVRRLDELGVLGTAFNAMAERIARSRASLTNMVAEHRDAEARVRAAQQRLEGVIRSSGAVLAELRVDDALPGAIPGSAEDAVTVEWISENVPAILGYDVDETTAPEWWSRNVHHDDAPGVMRRGETHAFAEGAREYRFRHKDGTYRWLREERRLIAHQDGVTRFACAWLDITEQRQLADRLRQTQKMEAVGRLAGGVSHDFNNLLSVISGFSEILIAEGKRQHKTDADLEGLVEIKSAAGRAAALTRQLLAFSRQQVLRPHDVDLSSIVGNAEKMLDRLAGDDVTLTLHLDGNLPAVFADPGQIEQVLVNLVVNARDAMPNGGTVTIETRRAELDQSFRSGRRDTDAVRERTEYVALLVADTGTGMTAEVRDRIFEPFFTTKEPGKGTGLGLSTVQGIVEQSGGQLFVYTEPGQGTTFKLYFPCAVARRATGVGNEVAPSATSAGGTESILLVDDEPAVRRMTTATLTAAGYSVVEAADGSQALKLCADPMVPIDLVVTDMMMPVMDGRELARRVRVERPGTPMVFISGYSTMSMEADALIANGQFVEKPFTADALLGAVRAMLDRSKAARSAIAS